MTLGVYEFGKRLLDTNDLDPVYVLLYHADLPRPVLERWLLAYWGFYHVGTASWIAEATTETNYWENFLAAAKSKEYPRSSERRHYRADNALKSVAWLRERGVRTLFEWFYRSPNPTLSAERVMEYVRTWVGFGPWIAFKVADMLERLKVVDVTFSVEEAMYDSPRKAAEALWEEEGSPDLKGNSPGAWAIGRILNHPKLWKYQAPPGNDRPLGPQEAETILCKWKSYLGGHYHVGEDVKASKESLLKFPKVRLCRELMRAGTTAGLW